MVEDLSDRCFSQCKSFFLGNVGTALKSQHLKKLDSSRSLFWHRCNLWFTSVFPSARQFRSLSLNQIPYGQEGKERPSATLVGFVVMTFLLSRILIGPSMEMMNKRAAVLKLFHSGFISQGRLVKVMLLLGLALGQRTPQMTR
jgi:hypothetical protein